MKQRPTSFHWSSVTINARKSNILRDGEFWVQLDTSKVVGYLERMHREDKLRTQYAKEELERRIEIVREYLARRKIREASRGVQLKMDL